MVSGENIIVPKEYLERLEKKVEDLKILTEVSAIISSTLDFRELMTIVMEKAKSLMNAEGCSILLYNRETGKLEFEVALCGDESTSDALKTKITLDIGQGVAGWVAEKQEVLCIKDVKADARFYQDADRQTGFVTKSLIAVPLIGRRGLIGVAEIINPRKEDYDIDILKLLSKHFAIAIENALYYRESIEKERLKQELEIAASLQKSFLPESPTFTRDNLTAAAVNIPARQVGGDLYDFIEPVEGKVGIFIGDVSGKGVSAALYMAKIISDFRYIANGSASAGTVMDRLNSLLSRAPRGMFLTAVYMIVDTKKGKMNIAVAGHPPFLWLRDGKVKIMSVPAGPPLGIVSGNYPASKFSLRRGDRLLFLTDGAFEAKNRKGQRMGFDSLVDFVKERMDKEPLTDMIVGHVNRFSRGMERADDLTIVDVRFGWQ
jgi:sigma-B regulation protein RsbU (phosphoserine phosphatase)